MRRFGKLLVVVMLCASISSSYAALVGHWTFDETAGAMTAVDATGGTNGAINGGVTVGVPGVYGTAYEFDGSGYVDMANAAFISGFVGTGSISYWLKSPVDNGTGRNVAVFLGDDTVSDKYIDTGIQNDDFIYGRDRGGNISEILSPATYNDGQWHHVVFVIDAYAGHSLYIDGSLVASNTSGLQLTSSINNFEIGRLGRSSPTDYFHGVIDDVRIYDEALTLDQVQGLSNPKLASNPDPSIGSRDIPVDRILSWDAPDDPNVIATLGYDVYLDPNEANVANGLGSTLVSSGQLDALYDHPINFLKDTTYYWRVDAINQLNDANSTVETLPGFVWSFETVTASPMITLQPVSIRADQTDADAVLTCEFTSVAASTVQWYKDDQLLSAGGDIVINTTNTGDAYTTTLQILTPAIADSGAYYCVIDNGNEVNSDTAFLVINRLLAHYQFEQNADDSVGTNHGTAIPSMAYSAGQIGSYAVDPNGGDYIELSTTAYPKAGLGNGLERFTYSFWVKHAPSSEVSILGNFNDSLTTAIQVNITESGAVLCHIRQDNNTSIQVTSSDGLISADQWHYVVLRFDGQTLSASVDGELAGEAVRSTPLTEFADWQYPMVLCAKNGRGTIEAMFPGELDDLQIYNDVLTDEDIAQTYYDVTGKRSCIHEYANDLDVSGPDMVPDCVVNVYDFAVMAESWLSSGLYPLE